MLLCLNSREVYAVTSAKVPIVRFYHLATQIEGDISVYNTLALENTKMLSTYSSIDWRVKVGIK
jgi:terminal uridylyltransferase